ncbi:MAG: DNA primase [Gammaproteobacteria bacterium]|nr:DNA primase [Gammaproteobacteria bacterium]
MAGRFTPQFLEDLLSRIDIIDLIDARVTLKSSGANFVACCPFHTEKTPSFTVSRTKQFYHCFGCGAHGDAIAFVMAFDRLSFPEAVASLAQTAGVSLPDAAADDPRLAAERGRARKIYETQERVSRFYARLLNSRPLGAQAAEYLQRRGITADSVERFRLGYAPPGWNSLPQDWDRDALREAGLTVARDGSQYDRFRDRIIFPIRDRRGRTVGFGGRVLDDSLPKYLNSPETPVFKKHREVYGLFEALEAERSPARIIVVEGYLDVIALAQFGITSTVATLGTATSADHITLLFRFTEELVFCFDGDAAGVNAAWKAVVASLPVLPEGKTLRFLRLPDGQDPDSLIRAEGPEAFRSRVAASPPLSDYFFAELGSTTGIDTLEGRAKLVKQATPLLQSIPPGPFRQMMLGKLGELTSRRPAFTPTKRWEGRRLQPPSTPRPSAHFRMLALLTAHPELAALIDDNVRTRAAQDPLTGRLFAAILSFLRAHPNADSAALRAHLEAVPRHAQIEQLLALDPLVPEGGLQAEFEAALQLIVVQSRERRLEHLIRQSRGGELSADERDEMRRLIAKHPSEI